MVPHLDSRSHRKLSSHGSDCYLPGCTAFLGFSTLLGEGSDFHITRGTPDGVVWHYTQMHPILYHYGKQLT